MVIKPQGGRHPHSVSWDYLLVILLQSGRYTKFWHPWRDSEMIDGLLVNGSQLGSIDDPPVHCIMSRDKYSEDEPQKVNSVWVSSVIKTWKTFFFFLFFLVEGDVRAGASLDGEPLIDRRRNRWQTACPAGHSTEYSVSYNSSRFTNYRIPICFPCVSTLCGTDVKLPSQLEGWPFSLKLDYLRFHKGTIFVLFPIEERIRRWPTLLLLHAMGGQTKWVRHLKTADWEFLFFFLFFFGVDN